MTFSRFMILLTLAVLPFAFITSNDVASKCHQYCSIEAISCSKTADNKSCASQSRVCRGQCDVISPSQARTASVWNRDSAAAAQSGSFASASAERAKTAGTQTVAQRHAAKAAPVAVALRPKQTPAELCVQRCDLSRHSCTIGGNDADLCESGRSACAARCGEPERSFVAQGGERIAMNTWLH